MASYPRIQTSRVRRGRGGARQPAARGSLGGGRSRRVGELSAVVDIVGARVRLRSFTLDDVEPIAAAQEADPTSFGPGGEELRARLRKQIERNPTLEDGEFLDLAIGVDGRLVGDVQARMPPRAWPGGVCEIGISLFADARGEGFGREAVKLFTDYLFREGLERVQASTSVDNAAMRRVLELVGYGFEGILRSYGPTPDGGREDYAMYAATREDWPALPRDS